MSRAEAPKAVIKRRRNRALAVFIDGTGLDRATRRINKRVDMQALIRGVASGLTPAIARYYTLIPYEDDHRHRAFLDAVYRAGLDVVVKRLPPKGVTRQVSVDVEMAADIVAFALGHGEFSSLGRYEHPGSAANASGASALPGGIRSIRGSAAAATAAEEHEETAAQEANSASEAERIVTIVCPSRDLAYPIALARELGADTVTADFAYHKGDDILKSAAKWIDLTDSETIWKE